MHSIIALFPDVHLSKSCRRLGSRYPERLDGQSDTLPAVLLFFLEQN